MYSYTIDVTFLVYVNFMILGFKRSIIGLCFIQYVNMFCMMEINVEVPLVHAPLTKANVMALMDA
jgi:hypothetical protein